MDDTQKPFIGLKTLTFAATCGSIPSPNAAKGHPELEEKLGKGSQEVPSCHAQPTLHEFPLLEKRCLFLAPQGFAGLPRCINECTLTRWGREEAPQIPVLLIVPLLLYVETGCSEPCPV